MSGAEDRSAGPERQLQAMVAEALLDTSPGSLGMASFALTRAFGGGREDIDGYVYLLKLLVQHALGLAERHPAQAREYRAAAVPMTYNLATNTWAGWGAGNVGAVDEAHRRLGLEAARKNVELAAEVGFGPERRRNGYWVLGAQLLQAGDAKGARQAFATSGELAREAGDEHAALMAEGWGLVADILGDRDEAAALCALKARMRSIGGDAAIYADQYDTAIIALRRTSQANP
jgi:hypothetical protein